MRDTISRHEGTPYPGRRDGEERRDVFTAEVDYGASIVRELPGLTPPVPVIQEPVFTIVGSGESRGDFGRDDDWHWGTGTNLRVSRSSIPALQRVLADLLEANVTY